MPWRLHLSSLSLPVQVSSTLHTQLPVSSLPHSLFSPFSLLLAVLSPSHQVRQVVTTGPVLSLRISPRLRKHAHQHACSWTICTTRFTRPSLSSLLTGEPWLPSIKASLSEVRLVYLHPECFVVVFFEYKKFLSQIVIPILSSCLYLDAALKLYEVSFLHLLQEGKKRPNFILGQCKSPVSFLRILCKFLGPKP